MDDQSHARVLGFAICELAMPVKRHVYNFAANYQSSLNHHLLTASAKAATRAKNKINFRKQPKNIQPTKKQRLSTLFDRSNTYLLQDKTNHLNGIHSVKNQAVLKEIDCIGDQISDTIIDNQLDAAMDYIESVADVVDKTVFESEQPLQVNPCIKEDLEEATIIEASNAELDNYENETYSIPCTDSDQVPSLSDEMSGFYSDPLLLCSDTDFMMMFRMNRTSFQKVLLFVAQDELEPIENIPLYKKMLMVLWLMGTSASYNDAAQVFSVTEEAAANCFFDICATLYNRSDSAIWWPSLEEGAEIAARVEEQFGFSGVVGVLGCQYFPIVIPKDAYSRKDHFNAYLRTYCISLQIVCDDRLIIRDIFPGLPGGKQAAYVLRQSPLCKQLTSKDPLERLVDSQKHIMARNEYPQLKGMLTPHAGHKTTLSKEEEDFDTIHESVCELVDQTFQMLEARFPTLKLLDPEVATMVLVSACVIHNICMENDDIFEPE